MPRSKPPAPRDSSLLERSVEIALWVVINPMRTKSLVWNALQVIMGAARARYLATKRALPVHIPSLAQARARFAQEVGTLKLQRLHVQLALRATVTTSRGLVLALLAQLSDIR